jgi:hypothetical protein
MRGRIDQPCGGEHRRFSNDDCSNRVGPDSVRPDINVIPHLDPRPQAQADVAYDFADDGDSRLGSCNAVFRDGDRNIESKHYLAGGWYGWRKCSQRNNFGCWLVRRASDRLTAQRDGSRTELRRDDVGQCTSDSYSRSPADDGYDLSDDCHGSLRSYTTVFRVGYGTNESERDLASERLGWWKRRHRHHLVHWTLYSTNDQLAA